MTRHALFFAPHNPLPPQTGAKQRFVACIQALQELDYHVIYVSSTLYADSQWAASERQALRRQLGVDVIIHDASLIDKRYLARIKATAPSEGIHWDYYTPPSLRHGFRRAFVERGPDLILMNYAMWGPLAFGDEYHSAIRIMDTQDLVSRNDKMQRYTWQYLPMPAPYGPEDVDPAFLKENFFENVSLEATREEFTIYDGYDVTLAVTPKEEIVIKRNTRRTVTEFVAGWTFTAEPISNTYLTNPIFVIGPNIFNYQGYLYYVKHIAPLMQKRIPGFTLTVAGSGCRQVKPAPGTNLLGIVPDLKELYQHAPYAVCPLIGGTGINIKIVEAMSYGVPVITLKNVTDEALIQHGVNGLVANNAMELAEYIHQLYYDRALCARLGAAARETVAKKFSAKILAASLERIISQAREKTALPQKVSVIDSHPSIKLKKEPRNILHIRTDSIGDAVLFSSLLKPFRERFPSARSTVLCQSHIAELFESSPFVDRVVTFDRKLAYKKSDYQRKLLLQLRKEKYDLVVNSVYSREPLTDLLAGGIEASERIAFDGDLENISPDIKAENDKYYTHLINVGQNRRTELEKYSILLDALSINNGKLQPSVWLKEQDEVIAQRIFSDNSLDPSKTIALFAGAQYKERLYHNYAHALKSVCVKQGFSIIALGSASEYDLNQVQLRSIDVRCVNLCGKLTLRQTAAVIKRCRLAVGAESGLAHIACAVGTPNVIVVGGGHFGRFLPYSPTTSVVSLPLDCYGCSWKCTYGVNHCIQQLKAEVLAVALENVSDHSSEKPRLYIADSSYYESLDGAPQWLQPEHLIDQNTVEVIHVVNPELKVQIEAERERENRKKQLLEELQNDPNSLPVLCHLAILNIEERKWNSALSFIGRAERIHNHDQHVKELRAQYTSAIDMIFAEADKCMKKSNYTDAELMLEGLIYIDDIDIQIKVLLELARIDMLRKNWDLAIDTLTFAKNIKPTYRPTLEAIKRLKERLLNHNRILRAEGLVKLNHVPDGIALFRQIMEDADLESKKEALNDLTILDIRLRDWEAGVMDCKKLLELDPEHEYAAKRMQYVRNQISIRAVVLQAEEFIVQRQLDGAQKLLQKVLSIDSEHVDALNDLAVVAILGNALPEAEKLLNTVFRLDPENEIARENMGYIQKSFSKTD